MYPMNYEEAILVSILIPVFNGDFSEIKESLDSIKNQSYTNFECILVDDSSDENITNSLRHYCEMIKDFYILEDVKRRISTILLRQCKENISLEWILMMCVIHRIKIKLIILLNTDISIVGSNIAI